MKPETRTAVIITVSDSVFAGARADVSGPTARREMEALGLSVDGPLVVEDDQAKIAELLAFSAARADLIVTTGGTGLGPRDVTPEATRSIIDREAPGLAELIRLRGLEKTSFASLSRGVCGIRGRCLIVNLPGSPKGVSDGAQALSPVLRHALEIVLGNTEHGEASMSLSALVASGSLSGSKMTGAW